MKYIIFIGALFLTAGRTVSCMEPWDQASLFNEDALESNEIDQILQTLDRETIFAPETHDNEIQNFPTPLIDFEGDGNFSLPLEDLSFIENIKPASVPNSPIKPIQASRKRKSSPAPKKQLSYKPAPASISLPEESPEDKQARKRFFKEMQERREQKKLKMIAEFSKSKNTESIEMKTESEQVKTQLQEIKDLERKELLPESKVVFIEYKFVRSETEKKSNPADSAWPGHILAMIAARNAQTKEQKKQT